MERIKKPTKQELIIASISIIILIIFLLIVVSNRTISDYQVVLSNVQSSSFKDEDAAKVNDSDNETSSNSANEMEQSMESSYQNITQENNSEQSAESSSNESIVPEIIYQSFQSAHMNLSFEYDWTTLGSAYSASYFDDDPDLLKEIVKFSDEKNLIIINPSNDDSSTSEDSELVEQYNLNTISNQSCDIKIISYTDSNTFGFVAYCSINTQKAIYVSLKNSEKNTVRNLGERIITTLNINM